jgi:hypothetical protein
VTEHEVIQVVLHPSLRKPFEDWLQHRGLKLARLPDEVGEAVADDLPTYVIGYA